MEGEWRKLIESEKGYVAPVTHALRLVPQPRAKAAFSKVCLKIVTADLPEHSCIYVMRLKGSDILRIGTAEFGIRDRVVRGYNRPYQSTHPTMTHEKIHYEWGSWAGGAHLTNALVLFGLSRAMLENELEVEVHAFRKNLLRWERVMLQHYLEVFGKRPRLNRGIN